MAAPVPNLTDSRVRNLEHRVGVLEEIAEAHENTLYKLRHDVIGLKLAMTTLLGHFGLARVTEEEIDAVFEAEGGTRS